MEWSAPCLPVCRYIVSTYMLPTLPYLPRIPVGNYNSNIVIPSASTRPPRCTGEGRGMDGRGLLFAFFFLLYLPPTSVTLPVCCN